MASLSNILLEKEILLESGTNELEILVFRVGGYSLGVNVAKVREVLPSQKITHLPKAHDSIVGCFTLREQVVPCVSLHRHLNEESANEDDEATIILTEFNQYQTAFVVDSVERIHRVSWEQVLASPSIVNNTDTPVTAVTSIEGQLVLMLDFEMIADQISEKANRTAAVENTQDLARETLRILLADDSATVREAVAETLRSSGYTNLTTFENGEQVWNWLQTKLAETSDVTQIADLLISDVEMPRIDGLHLTKQIKEHSDLKDMCVILYSSILTADNQKKGAAVKADEMITKPELTRIVELADNLIIKNCGNGEFEKTQAIVEHEEVEADDNDALAPPTCVEETDSSPDEPAGSSIWVTFRKELVERVDQLSTLCRSAAEDDPSDEVINDAFRVLHSIKSASMVVPVDEITQMTHFAEDLMAVVRTDKDHWPHSEMDQYVDWLREVANPENDDKELQRVLAEADNLEKVLTADAGA